MIATPTSSDSHRLTAPEHEIDVPFAMFSPYWPPEWAKSQPLACTQVETGEEWVPEMCCCYGCWHLAVAESRVAQVGKQTLRTVTPAHASPIAVHRKSTEMTRKAEESRLWHALRSWHLARPSGRAGGSHICFLGDAAFGSKQ